MKASLAQLSARARRLGVSGISGAVRRRLAVRARVAQLGLARKAMPLRRALARHVSGLRRPAGVNLIAYIRAEMGLGEAARGIASAFEAGRIPFGIINFEAGNPSRHTDLSWSHKEVKETAFSTTVVWVNPDNSANLKLHAPRSALAGPYLIGNWAWELPNLPEPWVRELSFYDEIWVPSRFVQESVARHARIPVTLVPHVIKVDLKRGFSRAHFGLPADRFLFLAMADTRSSLERKNPLGVIRAFKQAFGGNDERVGLAMKFNNPDFGEVTLRRVAEEAEGCSNIFFLQRVMSRDEVNGLVAAADCFVSLHRAEGFGLGPAEAMYLGKPAIITNWSGNTDYMAPDACAPVSYKLVDVGGAYGPDQAGQHWADPDVEDAAAWMQKLLEQPDLAQRMGLRGQAIIRSRFSASHVGQIVSGRLHQISRLAGGW